MEEAGMYANLAQESSTLAARPVSRDLFVVLALSSVAFILRVAVAERGGLWRDEALFVFVAQSSSWSSMVDFLRLHESHPPLFYALMRIWLSAVGDGDRSATALPIAIGVTLVPALYFVGASLFSRRTGVLAATLAAFSPALTEYSAQVRPYSLMPLLALLSAYSLILGIEQRGAKAWTAYVFSTLALVYTHNWGWLVVGGESAAVLALFVLGAGPSLGRGIKEWCFAQTAVAIGFLPWAWWLVYQATHAGHVASLYSNDGIAVYIINATRDFFQATLLAYPALDDASHGSDKGWFLALPVALLAADQFLRVRATRGKAPTLPSPAGLTIEESQERTALVVFLTVSLFAWLTAVVWSRVSDLLPARCLATLAPLLILSLSRWLTRPRTGGMLFLSRAAVAVLIITYCATLGDLVSTSRSNARELAAVVAANTKVSDMVIVAPEWLASSFNRYYAPDVEQIDYPVFGREGLVDFSGLRDRTLDATAFVKMQVRIADARGKGRRIWLLTDRADVREIQPRRLTRILNSGDYAAVAIVRANQLRTLLVSRYGPPDTTVTASGPRTRYEHFRAFLFVPGS